MDLEAQQNEIRVNDQDAAVVCRSEIASPVDIYVLSGIISALIIILNA